MTDFLLELLSEEIPARMQAKARVDLERLFTEQLAAAGLKAAKITVWSTPRRLALVARDLPEQTEAVSEEAKGPPEGAPDQAIEGFCRKNGVSRDQLELRDVKGRPTFFAVINKPGRATRDVLAEAIPAIIRAFPWPKSMRWGAASLSTESLRWVRPLSGIVAILGDDLVECSIDGIESGYETVGHRFQHQPVTVSGEPVEPRLSVESRPSDSKTSSAPTASSTVRPEPVEGQPARGASTSSARTGIGKITIGNAGDYAEKLRACHVIVDHEERQDIIRDGAAKAASDAGLQLVEDEGLVIENAGLTEWPVPLLGRFDPAFLDVPEEVIQLTARVNQKYFICRDKQGALAPSFVCTSNIDASDGGKAIIAGNEKVLAARLSDAKFFWELDQKTKLEDHAKKLGNIVFHEKLGTVADKVERVAKLAEWLASLEGTGLLRANPEQTEQAARLCKADLVTEMVGEFPELQGLMGGYYAEKQGLPVEVSQAIRDHYKPVGQGDEVPTDPVTVCVSLADKLDTLVGFFAIGEKPTGSKDPFALRRAALGIIRLLQSASIKVPLNELIRFAWFSHAATLMNSNEPVVLLVPMSNFTGGDFSLRSAGDLKLDMNWKMIHLLSHIPQNGEFHSIAWLPGGVNEVGKGQTDYGKFRDGIDIELSSFAEVSESLLEFFADRLKVQQREAGVRHDLIDAVFALGGEDDLVRLLARVKALQAFVETPDGVNLLAGYKRASNILKKEAGSAADTRPQSNSRHPELVSGSPEVLKQVQDDEDNADAAKPLSYTPEKAEKALIDALDAAQPQVTAAIAAEKFEAAMTALAALRAPIDRFFDEVTVNDEDESKREARLALLARFRKAVHQVADFSQIEG